MMICPHCGLSNSVSSKWCESCGCVLIVDDKIEIGKPGSSTTGEHKIIPSGFMGSMGETHYISEQKDCEVEDMSSKHISNFGFVGNMGSFSYKMAPSEIMCEGESSDVGETVCHIRLYGSAGNKSYRADVNGWEPTPIPSCKDHLGHMEDKGHTGIAPGTSVRIEKESTSFNLYGHIGNTSYKTELEKAAENSDTPSVVSTSNLHGQIGRTKYIRTAPDRLDNTKPADSAPSKKRLTTNKLIRLVIGVSGVLVLVLMFALLFSVPSCNNLSKKLEAAISSRISDEIIEGESLPLHIQYRNEVLRSIEFKVLKVNPSVRTATVTFSYADVPALMEQYAPISSDASEFYQKCIRAVSSGSAVLSNETIEILYTVTSANVRIEENETFLNVLTGGSLEEIQKMMTGA